MLLLKFWALFTQSESCFCFKLVPIVLMANSGGSRIPQPGTQTAKGVHQPYIVAINLFPENCMQLKKLQWRRRHVSKAPNNTPPRTRQLQLFIPSGRNLAWKMYVTEAKSLSLSLRVNKALLLNCFKIKFD